MTERATFVVADAANTGLAAASFGGVLSVDALQLMPKPADVLTEAVRLLVPGGVIAFTTWSLSKPWRNRVAVPDYRCLLQELGLEVLSYASSQGWRERQEAVYRLIRERVTDLEREVGSAVSRLLIEEAEAAPEALPLSTRVIAVARRPDCHSPQHAA